MSQNESLLIATDIICKGCSMYGDECAIHRARKQHECPCIKCLIKGICSISCEEWRILYREKWESITLC